MVGPTGIEPVTSSMSLKRSNQTELRAPTKTTRKHYIKDVVLLCTFAIIHDYSYIYNHKQRREHV